MKLYKPFTSFYVGGTVKERWVAALHDPGYWLLWFMFIHIVILSLIIITK